MIWEEAITEAFQQLEEASRPLAESPQTTGSHPGVTNRLLAAIAWALVASQLPRSNMSERVAAAAYKYVHKADDESLKDLKLLVSAWTEMVLRANPHLREKTEAAPEGGSGPSVEES